MRSLDADFQPSSDLMEKQMRSLDAFIRMLKEEGGLWIETTVKTRHSDIERIWKQLLDHQHGIFVWDHWDGTDVFIRDLRGSVGSTEYMARHLFTSIGCYKGCFIEHVVEAAPEPLVTID